ncbi:hypothetical protein DNK70_02300 [Klebsiella pneumoniae]|nr:hypothetical protein DNK70_02300 [Klebsiella pneumoniae]
MQPLKTVKIEQIVQLHGEKGEKSPFRKKDRKKACAKKWDPHSPSILQPSFHPLPSILHSSFHSVHPFRPSIPSVPSYLHSTLSIHHHSFLVHSLFHPSILPLSPSFASPSTRRISICPGSSIHSSVSVSRMLHSIHRFLLPIRLHSIHPFLSIHLSILSLSHPSFPLSFPHFIFPCPPAFLRFLLHPFFFPAFRPSIFLSSTLSVLGCPFPIAHLGSSSFSIFNHSFLPPAMSISIRPIHSIPRLLPYPSIQLLHYPAVLLPSFRPLSSSIPFLHPFLFIHFRHPSAFIGCCPSNTILFFRSSFQFHP